MAWAGPTRVEQAEVSPDWVYDIDTITTYFWHMAHEYEVEPAPTPAPKMDVKFLRYWLFEYARAMDEGNVVDYRRKWYEELIVNPSMVRVFQRMNPFEKRPKARQVIVEFCESMYKKHCLTKAEVCDEQAGSTLLRLSTDAMFAFAAQSIDTGNIYLAVYRTSLADANRKAKFPCIYRDRIRNLWVSHMGPVGGKMRYSSTSFTAAFMHMRSRMKAMKISPKIMDVDLSVWDKNFVAPE